MQTQIQHIDPLVAGVDEVGRGPLAGPVVAAAVIFRPQQAVSEYRDSKSLSARQRELLANRIRRDSLCWSIGWSDRAEIDAINILQATMLAMRRAVLGLSVRPRAMLVDGNRLPHIVVGQQPLPGEAIVGGDGSVAVIGAASILAKVWRDAFMVRMDTAYPGYAFAQHKGYGTVKHQQQLRDRGPCDLHRRSFAPVSAVL